MDSLPSGVMTLLFSDIEGSSSLWDGHRSEMAAALIRHNDILRAAIDEAGGSIVKDKGDGFFAVFASPRDALEGAINAQGRVQAEPWPAPIEINVRMAIHTGTVEPHDGDYYGPTVNQVARIEGLARGGQVLVSEATVTVLGDDLPSEAAVKDLGLQRLKGISRPIRVFQLMAPNLADDFPPLRSAGRVGKGLPNFRNSFVGRDQDRAELEALLADDTKRLVTLLGPGGIGKTRLAVETARALENETGDSAYFADLTTVQALDDVSPAIAEAIGVHVEGAASPIDLVADQVLAPTLMVVDNFEHVQQASGVVEDLLAAAPLIRVLATSRTPLRVAGETVFRVEPLSTSNSNGSRSPAVELFYERASGHGTAIGTEEDEVEAVKSIVARVDGLPLAIELVAARSRMIGVVELNDLLAKSLHAIGAGGTELPERQRTISSTIEWSLSNVGEGAQTLFRRMSALPGGATLALLERVARSDSASLLDDLTTLVDNSLIRVERGLPGGTRYSQLVPLREHGAALLEAAGEADEVMRRLVDYYTDAADELGRRFELSEDAEKELRTDHANLLAAMRWSLDNDRAADLARAFNTFWIYWFNADVAASAWDWLAAADDAVVSPYLDWLIGLFAFQKGDFEELGTRMSNAFERFAEIGDEAAAARAKMFLGAAKPGEGTLLLDEALEYFSSDRFGVSRYLPLLFLSFDLAMRGEIEEAVRLRREMLDWAQKAQYRVLTAWGHWNLAVALLIAGREEEGEHHAWSAFLIMSEDLYREGTASASDLIAVTLARRGEFGLAVEIFGAAEAIYESLNVARWFEVQHMVVDEVMEGATEALGAAEVDRLMSAGRELTMDELIALVNDSKRLGE